jgi:hypothetical protein
MQQIERLPPRPTAINPALSPAVENVLLKALQKKPANRYQTGRQLMDALSLALDVPEPTLPYLERPPAPVGPLPAPARPDKYEVAAAAGLRRGFGHVLSAGFKALKRGVRAAAPRVAAAPAAAKDDLHTVESAASRGVHGLAAGIQSGWSRVRTHPTTRAAIQRLRQDREARWAAGGVVLVLVALIVVWLAGTNFSAGRAAEPTPESSEAAAQASATAEQAAAAPTEAPTAEAVNPPPAGQGDHYAIFYDDTSFYFRNDSKNDRPISPVAFERVMADGSFANRYDGGHWAQIYPTIQSGWCMVLELLNYRDHLKPKDCKNKHQVYRTPNINEPFIFWTTQEGSTQFRVLWNDAEVGRCEIAAQYCDVYLP